MTPLLWSQHIGIGAFNHGSTAGGLIITTVRTLGEVLIVAEQFEQEEGTPSLGTVWSQEKSAQGGLYLVIFIFQTLAMIHRGGANIWQATGATRFSATMFSYDT